MLYYISGTYEGAARGYIGKVVVSATVTENKITDVAVVKALKAAGATDEDIEELKAAPGPVIPKHQDEVRTVDVVVCGGGGLGRRY